MGLTVLASVTRGDELAEDECADASVCKEIREAPVLWQLGDPDIPDSGDFDPETSSCQACRCLPEDCSQAFVRSARKATALPGCGPRLGAIARRPAGFAAAVPTVRILSISYRLLSNTFAQVFSSDA
jgi:hypothetical protein